MKRILIDSGFILQRSHPAMAICLTLILLVLAGACDFFLPPSFSLSFLYAIPVLFMAWYFGPVIAGLMMILTGSLWVTIEFLTKANNLPLPVVLWNTFMQLVLMASFAYLVLRLRHMIEQNHETARRDTVTGLSNSRTFYEIAEIEVMRAKRYGHPISLAFIDLDDFKLINERYGHPVGDRLLAEFAHLAFSIFRRTDTVARIGGDEFVILMPETNQDESKAPIEKLRQSMDTVMKENNWPITLSIGVYTFLTMPNNLQVMITFADSLMCQVKLSGKNQVAYEIFADEKATEIDE